MKRTMRDVVRRDTPSPFGLKTPEGGVENLPACPAWRPYHAPTLKIMKIAVLSGMANRGYSGHALFIGLPQKIGGKFLPWSRSRFFPQCRHFLRWNSQ